MATVFGEAKVRLLSPVLFLAAVLMFLLPFAGVSCNTSTAQSTIGSLGQLASPQEQQAMKQCFDDLNNFNFATYTGVNLAFGTAPTVNNDEPASCKALNQASGGTASSATDPNQAKTPIQPFALIAFVLAILGIIVGLLHFPLSRLLTATVAAAALVFLGLQLARQKDVINQVVQNSASSQGQQIPGIDFSAFFNVNIGIGAWIAVVLLAVALLVNLASQLVGGAAKPAAAAAGGGMAPPPGPTGAGMGYGGPPPASPPSYPPSSPPPPATPPTMPTPPGPPPAAPPAG